MARMKVPEAIGIMIRTLPPSPLILIACDPYSYPFHVGMELARTYFTDLRWYIVVSDIAERYLDIIRRNFGIRKDNIEIVHGLCNGVRTLAGILNTDGNLAYIVINAHEAGCVGDYINTISSRPPRVNTVVIIQVDEAISKPFAYLADLVVRLKSIEDVSKHSVSVRVARFITTRTYSEVVLSYSVLPTGVVFEETYRV